MHVVVRKPRQLMCVLPSFAVSCLLLASEVNSKQALSASLIVLGSPVVAGGRPLV